MLRGIQTTDREDDPWSNNFVLLIEANIDDKKLNKIYFLANSTVAHLFFMSSEVNTYVFVE